MFLSFREVLKGSAFLLFYCVGVNAFAIEKGASEGGRSRVSRSYTVRCVALCLGRARPC